MRKKIIFLVSALSLTAFSPFVLAADLKDGQWEFTVEMEMPGMKMPPTTFTQCLTSNNMVPQGKEQNPDTCKMKAPKVSGNTVAWEGVCKQDGSEMEIKGKATYAGITMSGETLMTDKKQGMSMTSRMKGRYLGSCK